MSQALTFNGKTLHPVSHNNEMWFTAADLSRALGYEKETAATQIYARNKGEFLESMSVVLHHQIEGGNELNGKCKVGCGTQSEYLGESRGLQKMTRIFSLRGCHLIAMFAKTVIAKQFRVWVLNLIEGKVPEPAYGLKETLATISVHSYSGIEVLEKNDFFKVSQLCLKQGRFAQDFVGQKRYKLMMSKFPAAKVATHGAERGTWVHRGVFVPLAYWLSQDCGDWARDLVEKSNPAPVVTSITLADYMTKVMPEVLRAFGVDKNYARGFLV